MSSSRWDELGARESPAWYLDPVVALQKREVHVDLLRRVLEQAPPPRRVLKTDLFEEACGEDQLLGDFPSAAGLLCGLDTAFSEVLRTARRFPRLAGGLVTADLRRLPFRDEAFDFVLSTSSLDHFDTFAELEQALAEIARVLAPGGRLLITFDNLWNPLYHLLRSAGRAGLLPFPLGRTPSPRALPALLRRHGLEAEDRHWLIHNPRGVSTLVFLALRRLLGRHAGGPIRFLLHLFALGGRLPTRRFTACFVAVCARKHP